MSFPMNNIRPFVVPLLLLTLWSLGCSGGSAKGGTGGAGGVASGGSGDSTNAGAGAGNMGTAGTGAGGQGGNDMGMGGTGAGTGGTMPNDPNVVTRLIFDNPSDLAANFFLPEGTDGVQVKDGALVIGTGKPHTLVFDRTPDATPTDSLGAPLTISFRFKANTTPQVPPVSVTTRGDLGSPQVWVSFYGGSDRKNAGQIRLRWSEVDEDRLSFRTGIDLGASATPGTEVWSNVEWNPLFNGDVYYTMRVVLRRMQGTPLHAGVEVLQDGHLLLRRAYTFPDLPIGAGEIAIGGDAGRGNGNDLLMDDFELRKGGEALEEPKFTPATVAGQPARMYLPSQAPVKGILLLAPGSGGTTEPAVEGEANRLFAKLHGFAVIGYKNGLPSGSLDTLFAQLGQMTNHPELTTVPLVMYGFSAGTIDITSYANGHASRVIGLVPDSYASATALTGAAQKIPSLFLLGQNDTVSTVAQQQASLQQVRTNGGAVGFLVKQGLPHTPKGTDTIFLPYLDRAIAIRYANYTLPLESTVLGNGWLLDNASYSGLAAGVPNPVAKISTVANFVGNANAATWLPSEDAAMATAAYATYEKVVAISPLPHGKAGENRTVTLRVRDDMKDYTELKLFDFANPLTTLGAGTPLTFAWNNIPAGLHALNARMTRAGKEHSSFVVTLIMLP
jgi:hypothetical protein